MNIIKEKIESYSIFIIVGTIACFVVFITSIFLPPTNPICYQPNVFCEPSPLPMFAGLGSMIGVFTLYLLIRDKLDRQNRRKVE